MSRVYSVLLESLTIKGTGGRDCRRLKKSFLFLNKAPVSIIMIIYRLLMLSVGVGFFVVSFIIAMMTFMMASNSQASDGLLVVLGGGSLAVASGIAGFVVLSLAFVKRQTS